MQVSAFPPPLSIYSFQFFLSSLCYFFFFLLVLGLYMAPELYHNEAHDISVDIYSFGMILYEVREIF